MTPQEDVERLEREFAEAMQRMFTVGNGLVRLRVRLDEQRPGTAAPRTAGPAPAPVASGLPGGGPRPAGGAAEQGAAAPPVPAPRALPAHPLGDPPVPPHQPARPSVPWYRREGAVTRVLALAGAVITLAGVAMLLVIAVRNGFFGPAARVTAGAVLALVLGGLGARGGARDRARRGAVGSAPVALVATGAAAAYLDVVAVSAGYGWVPAAVGLALCVAVAAAGLSLARAWSSELLAVVMVGGAAAFSPLVAGSAGWLLSAVLAVLALAGWWAGGGRRTPVLTMVRTSPVVLSLLVGATVLTARGELLALLAVAVVVLLGTLVTSAVSLRTDGEDVTSTLAVALTTVGLLGVVAAQGETVRWVAFALTAAVLLLAATALGRAPLGPLPTHLVVSLASGGAVAAVLAVVAGAPADFIGTGLLLLALGHVATASVTRSRLSLAVAGGVATVALLAWLQHPFAILLPSVATRHDLPVAFVDSALAAGLVVLAAWAVEGVRGVPAGVRTLTRVIAWAVGLAATTTAFVSVGTLLGTRFDEPVLGFTAGHAVSTLAWMVAAATLLLRSLDRPGRSDAALRGGLVIAGLAIAKLFLFDLAALDGVVRSVAFIGTGLLLLATGSRYARAWERIRSHEPLPSHSSHGPA